MDNAELWCDIQLADRSTIWLGRDVDVCERVHVYGCASVFKHVRV